MKQNRVYGVLGWLNDAGLMYLGEDNVLWHSRIGTIFKKRSDAINALNRTKRYAKRKNFPWELNKCKIQIIEHRRSLRRID